MVSLHLHPMSPGKWFANYEFVAGNYMVRYMFAAAGSAVCLPAVRKVGVGWFSTISAVFLIVATLATYLTTLKGKDWREAVNARKVAKTEGENHV